MKVFLKLVYHLPGMVFMWIYLIIRERKAVKAMLRKNDQTNVATYFVEKYKTQGMLITEVVSFVFWASIALWWAYRLIQ